MVQRAQLMTAQMAAHKCLGEILIEMGHTPPERLIDGINMAINVGILTTNQAWHLKSVNAAANSAMHHIPPSGAEVSANRLPSQRILSKVYVGCMRGVPLLQNVSMRGRRPRKLSIEAALEATGGEYAAS